MEYSKEEIQKGLEFIRRLSEDGGLFASLSEEERISVLTDCGKISRPNADEIRKRNREVRKAKRREKRTAEKKARAATGIREARKDAVFKAPLKLEGPKNDDPEMELKSPRNCYVCKKEYTKLHFFYDSMCRECGDFNYEKRFQRVPLHGKTALITGARVKIGYHCALMMLRSGAKVIVTTRFPADSAGRFAKEEDFSDWADRLEIHGLDLRHTPSVEIFCNYIIHKEERLDILINNAAQTVRRPPEFYTHLMEKERLAFEKLGAGEQKILSAHKKFSDSLYSSYTENSGKEMTVPSVWHGKAPGIGIRASAELSQIPYNHDSTVSVKEEFPEGYLDADLQQVDLRTVNSWRLKLGEIDTAEMIELQLINSIAPFVLCNRLVTLMKKDFTGEKHIVNVSAMEGKFHRFTKEDRHPHTNMAKAALNMLTHTAAGSLAKEGIFMNAVDTGWVTDEDPVFLSKKKEELHDFQPPLDIVDGAARVCDPVFNGILTGKHMYGKFLKDYFPIDW
ncbi:MAG TPA: SDR family oxidoreductase [Leptospiraceae bacterium]|nr:SDR family oxidoreductase [Leptospiraceae bacterium]HMY68489.1 SDR family oxidoreductase [Leptospiraceae bacterium]HNF14014.1 SDR family oxidoreductase [Leptospiraceae bacterium]HNI96667.1 SDR family oxidoreductase [Leptospiraceae bacterium]HNM05354.1 SDR family oxidoreductase [Leptospiraceae bacterium]